MLHQRGRDACEGWLRQAPDGTTLVAQENRPVFPSTDALRDVLA